MGRRRRFNDDVPPEIKAAEKDASRVKPRANDQWRRFLAGPYSRCVEGLKLGVLVENIRRDVALGQP